MSQNSSSQGTYRVWKQNKQRNRQQGKRFEYIPSPGSGHWAILVSMFKAAQHECLEVMTKQNILEFCKRYEPLASRDSTKTFACMQTLIGRGLVYRYIERDTKYKLTNAGKDLAVKLLEIKEMQSEDTDSRDSASAVGSQTALIPSVPAVTNLDGGLNFELKAGTFDIFLVIDQRERQSTLPANNSIKVDSRTLSCGDYLWVARPTGLPMYDKTRDLVLDYVIERKRFDDLQQSIMDKRIVQQKQRLLDTGVRRPMFMLEEYGIPKNATLTLNELQQKATDLYVVDKIEVQKVRNAEFANDFLIGMTKSLTKLLSNKDLRSCSHEKMKNLEADKYEFITFSEFQSKGAKITNWTVKDMFSKHLIQITGMSDMRVYAIVEKYPTIQHLRDAYAQCNSDSERENLLAKLRPKNSTKNIGPVVSSRVYAAYAKAPAIYDGAP